MKVISVKTNSKQYDVCIGYGIVNKIQSYIKSFSPKVSKILIISDDQVASFYLNELEKQITDVESYIIPNGEQSKSFTYYEKCLAHCFECKLDRNSLIIALGGGVVGDLAGFVAATYMRGIRFIQVPTTLLAHDSAVGGKVAINLPKAKNIVGAFYQPELVLYELSFLDTLPIEEWRSGFAEIVKEALISSKENVSWLMNEISSLDKLEPHLIQQCVSMGIDVKNKIVSEDERESGIRAYLNLGHTLGHAIEAYLGYSKTTHGEAIAFGTLFAIFLSEQKFNVDLLFNEIVNWFKRLNYPIYTNLNTDTLIDLMKQDKKNVDLQINYVLLNEIGEPILCQLDETYIKDQLNRFLTLLI